MTESVGYFIIDKTEDDGTLRIIGTSTTDFTDVLAQAPSGRCFLSGVLINHSPQDYFVKITTTGGEQAVYHVRGYEAIRFKKHPFERLEVAVNGTIALSAIGYIVDATRINLEIDHTDLSMLLTAEIVEMIPEMGRSLNFDSATHTDIVTATTTTIATPTTGFTLRIYKVTIAVQGASRPILQFTASGGGSVNIIGSINFTAEGTFVYDFGDKGLSSLNGVDGILRIVSNNVAVLDIDVVSRSD